MVEKVIIDGKEFVEKDESEKTTNRSCYFCYSCYSCNFCNFCNFCNSCNSCDFCNSCKFCDFCNSCYFCNSCDFCKFCDSSRHLLFCTEQELSKYKIFNVQLEETNWSRLRKKIIDKIGYKKAKNITKEELKWLKENIEQYDEKIMKKLREE